MGGHASFGLGVALSLPDERVILFDSEGDVLMNMGALPTIAEKAPKNFYHFMLDNECYATTGGQPVPNAKNIAYEVIAKGSGLPGHLRLRQPGRLCHPPGGDTGTAWAGICGPEGES